MESKITIVCFDINSSSENDYLEVLGQNIYELECPLRILDELLEMDVYLETSKNRKNESEFKYTFETKLYDEKVIFEIIVIYDLSYIHNISLDADAYILFINLEKKNTKDQLEKIITYIIDNCSINIKTYIIGIFKDKILPNLNKELIEIFFEEKNINYEYYQVKCKDNICNNIKKDNKNNKEIKGENEEENSLNLRNKSKKNKNIKTNLEFNLFDTILTINKQIYEIKISDNSIDKPSNSFYSSKNYEDLSNSKNGCKCTIF